MLLIILLIYGLILLFRLPGILRKQPSDFPSPTPELFEEWRKAEIGSVVVVMIAGWGTMILAFLVGIGLALARMASAESIRRYATPINLTAVVIVIAGAIWASILSNRAKAARLKMSAPRPMDSSFYPRGPQSTGFTPPPPQDSPPQ